MKLDRLLFFFPFSLSTEEATFDAEHDSRFCKTRTVTTHKYTFVEETYFGSHVKLRC